MLQLHLYYWLEKDLWFKINDSEYKELGVNIFNEPKEVISGADIIVQLALPSDKIISLIKFI